MHWDAARATFVVRFIDQVLVSPVEVQDARAVAGLVETICARIATMVPHAKSVICQSDNAASYKSTQLMQWLGAVAQERAAAGKLRVARWVFSESQVCIV